jgi:hypothetical protein
LPSAAPLGIGEESGILTLPLNGQVGANVAVSFLKESANEAESNAQEECGRRDGAKPTEGHHAEGCNSALVINTGLSRTADDGFTPPE